jgi:ribosomal-protein-alanine N-acetyltransferase
MNKEMNIVKARVLDAAVFAEIAAASEHGAKWPAEAFAKEIRQPYAKIYKIENDKRAAVGFISYRVSLDIAEITNFAVSGPYRGLGLGAALLGATLDILKRGGVKEVTLEVNVNNEAALGLYSKFLFERAAVRKKFYNNTDDAALMRRSL